MVINMKKEALFYERTDNYVNCKLCPHRCNHLTEGQKGICKVREVHKDSDGQRESGAGGSRRQVQRGPLSPHQCVHLQLW